MIIKFQPFPAPWFPEARVERGLSGLFETLLNEEAACGCGTIPRLDMADSGNEFVVLAELPGMKKEDLKISVHDGVLTIRGERKVADVDGSRWVRNEIGAGKFQRSIELPAPVNGGKITATLADGILRVVLPKAEEARPREITIQ